MSGMASYFPHRALCEQKGRFFGGLERPKTLTFQMLAEHPTYAPRILDHFSRELYIPGHQACLWLAASLHREGGRKARKNACLR